MSKPGKVATAINYLRTHQHHFEFDDNERVVKVSVYDSVDADEVAAHVGYLHDVEELTFERSNLTDEGLRHLKNLVNVRKLWLTSPNLTGDGLSSLIGMQEIEDLVLREVRLNAQGFEHLSRLENLLELSINGGSFCDADATPLGALLNLERISITYNDNIEGTFCQHLGNLTRLRRLAISASITDAGLANISRLLQLQSLSIEGSFTDAGLLQIRALEKLQSLCIASGFVTSHGVAVVAEFPELNSLDLETPMLSDDAVASLLRCSMLEDMFLRKAALTEAGVQRLREDLPHCSVKDFERDHAGIVLPIEDPTQPRFESNTPFKTLLDQANDWDLVNGTFVKIGDRYNHWVDAAAYSLEERVIMLVWHAGGIIGNGGFEYLFAGEFDGDPDFHITAEAHQIAGLTRSYEAFQEAFRLFPGGVVPHDPEERIRLYAAANRSACDSVDRKFWRDDTEGIREKKLAEFIRNNIDRLGDLDARQSKQ